MSSIITVDVEANEALEDIAQFIINESKGWQNGEGSFDLANALKEFIRLYLLQSNIA